MSAADDEKREPPRRAAGLRAWWRVLRLAYLRFGFSVASLMAAAIAFYSLLCLGPLGLLLAALLQSIFGKGGDSYRWLQITIRELGGQAAGQLMAQLDTTLSDPGAYVASAAGLVLLIWAGLRLFEVIERSLTEVWPGRVLRGYVGRKLVALLAMAVGGALICGVVALNAMLVVAEAHLRQIAAYQPAALPFIRPSLRLLVEFPASLLAFTLMYKFMPVQRVPFRVALAGGVFSAVVWHVISPIFTYSLAWSARTQYVYGGLAQVVTFSLWAFLGARLLLAGAYFAAAYQHVFHHRHDPSEDADFIGHRPLRD